MAPRTGSARLALFLFCCAGTWLDSHLAAVREPQAADRRRIIVMLEKLSSRLLEGYLQEEKGVPACTDYPLPCILPPAQPADHVNSSAILPYFEAIKPALRDLAAKTPEPPLAAEPPELRLSNLAEEITQQLDKLPGTRGPVAPVSAPQGAFRRKCFVAAVLSQFSTCMQAKSASLRAGAPRVP